MSAHFEEQARVLHVDDELDFADLTETFLERKTDRLVIEAATRATEGLKAIRDRLPDCVVSDYHIPGMDGLEFLQAVREECPDLPFILYTGRGSKEVASEAISAGATDYLQKGGGTEQYTHSRHPSLIATPIFRRAMGIDRMSEEYAEKRS